MNKHNHYGNAFLCLNHKLIEHNNCLINNHTLKQKASVPVTTNKPKNRLMDMNTYETFTRTLRNQFCFISLEYPPAIFNQPFPP